MAHTPQKLRAPSSGFFAGRAVWKSSDSVQIREMDLHRIAGNWMDYGRRVTLPPLSVVVEFVTAAVESVVCSLSLSMTVAGPG